MRNGTTTEWIWRKILILISSKMKIKGLSHHGNNIPASQIVSTTSAFKKSVVLEAALKPTNQSLWMSPDPQHSSLNQCRWGKRSLKSLPRRRERQQSSRRFRRFQRRHAVQENIRARQLPAQNSKWAIRGEKNAGKTSRRVRLHDILPLHSPGDESGGHGRPGDAAGAGLLALLLLLPPAAAQAAQVDGQTQQVEAQAGGRHAAQEDQRLQGQRNTTQQWAKTVE